MSKGTFSHVEAHISIGSITLWANSAVDKFMVFFYYYFSEKTGFDISFKLSPVETIYMKCQILFSGKKMSSAENVTQNDKF